MKLRERFIEALKARGERLVESRSQRYTTLTRTAGGFYFIGRSGAVRFGKAASTSVACSERFKNELLGGATGEAGKAGA